MTPTDDPKLPASARKGSTIKGVRLSGANLSPEILSAAAAGLGGAAANLLPPSPSADVASFAAAAIVELGDRLTASGRELVVVLADFRDTLVAGDAETGLHPAEILCYNRYKVVSANPCQAPRSARERCGACL